MNRKWITGLTLAGVVGSGGAAFAGIAAGDDGGQASSPAATQANLGVTADGTVTGRTVSYQVGAAGTVTLTIADGALTVTGTSATTGWTVLGVAGAGTHAEVHFGDALQLVTFAADLVGDEVTVTLATDARPAAQDGTGTGSQVGSQVGSQTAPQAGPQAGPETTAAAPQQATTAPLQPTLATPTTSATPPPAATTSPSGAGSGEDDEDDDHEGDDDEHDDEDDDHDDD